MGRNHARWALVNIGKNYQRNQAIPEEEMHVRGGRILGKGDIAVRRMFSMQGEVDFRALP